MIRYTIIIFMLIITSSSIIRYNSIVEMEDSEFSEFSDDYFDPSYPKSIMMYESIERYSDEYKIPKKIAYNIAFKETRYRGPFHMNYNPHLTSSGGAEGPMQVLLSTARGVNRKDIRREQLRNDIDLNVSTSMMLLRRLYNKFGSWEVACAFYNTGKTDINDYARYCINNNHRTNWIKPEFVFK